MIKKIIILITYLITLLIAVVWTYENKDKLDLFKKKIKKYSSLKTFNEDLIFLNANSFEIEVTKIINFKKKTSFILNRSFEEKFNLNDIDIYYQDGYVYSDKLNKKFNLNKNLTFDYNGGIKSVLVLGESIFGLHSSLHNECYYFAITNLINANELFKSDCLEMPEPETSIDFNGLGSAFIDMGDFILISVGTPTSDSNSINILAQNKKSNFGKILKINKKDIQNNFIIPEVYSMGHRNPQGITKYRNKIFSVEHGPRGGDELNLIKQDFNYGWPIVSYGTRYLFDNDGKSYLSNHEKNGFEPPIYSFIPSIGISSLNNCPAFLENYYLQNCLIALSLNGNQLRSGNSILIFLLDESLNKVQVVEKISFLPGFALRHFMTNEKNEIYYDEENSIYISADNKGLYKFKFKNFR